MELTAATKVHELLATHPFLEDFLASYDSRFEMLRNRMARATVGRLATLRTAASIANLDLNALLQALASEIERQTGTRPAAEPSNSAVSPTREQRLGMLKDIIRALHDGERLETARARFASAVEDVEATEIAAMEEELIRGGLPVSEVQRLCDVHVGAFKEALDQHTGVDVPAGHPIHTYLADNGTVTRLAERLGDLARAMDAGQETAWRAEALDLLQAMSGLENHYQRKENQLFPMLERHGVTGPSQVMWGVHDEIRAALKSVRAAAESADAAGFTMQVPALIRDVVEMVYKEEKILFPMSLETLSRAEWNEVRRGEDELGYVLTHPARTLPIVGDTRPEDSTPPAGLLGLQTGELTLEQLNLVLTHLPLDLSFVDEEDTVRFYSEGPHRIFPRSPAVIGRKVQRCHPPKSVHIVQEILDSFRKGTESSAEFWIQLHGRFVHIRYLAVRDKAGAYRGCLEVSQDATAVRALEGERRLLQWR